MNFQQWLVAADESWEQVEDWMSPLQAVRSEVGTFTIPLTGHFFQNPPNENAEFEPAELSRELVAEFLTELINNASDCLERMEQ